MTSRKICGGLLLSLPFVGLFVLCGTVVDWGFAFAVFGFCTFVIASFVTGVSLLNSDLD